MKYTTQSTTQAAPAKYSLLSPGTYELAVADAQETQSQAGNPMMELRLRRVNTDGTLGQSVWDRLVLTPKAAWRIDNFLHATGRHPGAGKEIELEGESLIGLTVSAEIEIEEYKGEKKNKVARYVTAGDGF
jgi:hypothetical protein